MNDLQTAACWIKFEQRVKGDANNGSKILFFSFCEKDGDCNHSKEQRFTALSRRFSDQVEVAHTHGDCWIIRT
jgi:hypothetical protein